MQRFVSLAVSGDMAPANSTAGRCPSAYSTMPGQTDVLGTILDLLCQAAGEMGAAAAALGKIGGQSLRRVAMAAEGLCQRRGRVQRRCSRVGLVGSSSEGCTAEAEVLKLWRVSAIDFKVN